MIDKALCFLTYLACHNRVLNPYHQINSVLLPKVMLSSPVVIMSTAL